MNELMKSLLIKILGLAGLFPTRRTEANEISSLLERLHPWEFEHGLLRLGPKGDGGYLVPNDLSGISALFSPGVSQVSGFEKDCGDRGMTVFLADQSVDGPAESHDRFNFTKKFIGSVTRKEYITLDDWVNASLLEKESDLLLQMDIEGYEFEVIISASEKLMRRFRIIVIEFHNLHYLWSRPYFKLATAAFDKILQNHSCVHIHPNNSDGKLKNGAICIPKLMEFTFLRNDRFDRRSYQRTFPHPLDCDNTKNANLGLPSCWYGKP